MPTIVNQPSTSEVNLIGHGFVFRITQPISDTRRLGYQLFDSNDVPLTSIESTTGSNIPIVLDFRLDILSFLRTRAPQLHLNNAFGLRSESSMLMRVKLKYWEIVYDKETCKTSIEGEVTTPEYKVLNGSDQFYGNYVRKGAYAVLGNVYSKYTYRTLNDLMYLYADGFSQITLTYYNGNTAFQEFVGIGDGVYSFNPIWNSQGSRTEMRVDGILVTTFIRDCEHTDTKIYYQSSAGGYSLLDFNYESKSVSTSHSLINTFQQPIFAPSQKRLSGGRRIGKSQETKSYSLYRMIHEMDEQDHRMYEDFLSSESYYILIDNILVPFKIDSSTPYWTDGDTKFQITGSVLQQHHRPNPLH